MGSRKDSQQKRQNVLMLMLCVFIIIQPFLDIRILFTDARFRIIGITIPTFVRCVGIFIMFIFLMSLNKTWKELWLEYRGAVFYLVCVGLYFIGHHIVAYNIDYLPSTYQYSLSKEVFYFIRMILPFVIIFLVRKTKITYDRFMFCIQMVSFIIGIVIIVTNLLHISETSYATASQYNQLNFIEWFTKGTQGYSFEELTSKGWFFMANQVGALMLLMLPFNLCDLLKRHTLFGRISTLTLSVSMILLGTRVATYGLLGMYFIYLLLIVFFVGIKKEKIAQRGMLTFILLFLIIVGLFWKSPIKNRIYSYGNVNVVDLEEIICNSENIDSQNDEYEKSNTEDVNGEHELIKVEESNDEHKQLNKEQSDDELGKLNKEEKFILNNIKNYKISNQYIYEIYPYDEDTQFWIDFMEENQGAVKNNREIQKMIVNRIDVLNPSMINKLFGNSYTRFTSGGLYLEQDVIIHYYTLGLIGVILLLGPWMFYILIACTLIFKEFKNRFTFINCTYVIGILACIGCSLFSGHVLDELIVTLILGFTVGSFLKTLN